MRPYGATGKTATPSVGAIHESPAFAPENPATISCILSKIRTDSHKKGSFLRKNSD